MDELLARYAKPIYVVEPEAADEREMARLAEQLRAVPGIASVEAGNAELRVAAHDDAEVAARLLAAVATCGIPVVRFERQRPTLEDVFLQLVGRRAKEDAA
jgi:ABC-type uncharacterized transport system ATPase subunit